MFFFLLVQWEVIVRLLREKKIIIKYKLLIENFSEDFFLSVNEWGWKKRIWQDMKDSSNLPPIPISKRIKCHQRRTLNCNLCSQHISNRTWYLAMKLVISFFSCLHPNFEWIHYASSFFRSFLKPRDISVLFTTPCSVRK